MFGDIKTPVVASKDYCDSIMTNELPVINKSINCQPSGETSNGSILNSSADRLGLRISVFQQSRRTLLVKGSLQDRNSPLSDLPYSTGETTLQKEFSNFGKIAEVKVVKDVITKRSKGFAFIQYTSQDDAMLALETMDQKVFHGRTICVEIATLGRDDFGAHPKTSGPPKKWNLPQQEETVDCWY
ncbi:hypothetical protein TanjilG_19296 [Lupinus angustifolius]|uniref:RRM domain-containing protein n=1 Tax=Lupinus angustifolius TaxID=3871 RepID=A0A1J7IUC6_LUPAN|nr:hypothetical protein TanjilG_19296 [Lupinus angustifolius]